MIYELNYVNVEIPSPVLCGIGAKSTKQFRIDELTDPTEYYAFID